ncbi:MAG: hypothetical protein K5857_09450 [Lachnospiraceae bacterium]|nr:hypothetical protein [Lachnospiraceae bacterium]
MKLSSVLRQRITLLLTSAMVITSVIPTGVPVYASDLITEDTVLAGDENYAVNTYADDISFEDVTVAEAVDTVSEITENDVIAPDSDIITGSDTVDACDDTEGPDEDIISGDVTPVKADPAPNAGLVSVNIIANKDEVDKIEYTLTDKDGNVSEGLTASYSDEAKAIRIETLSGNSIKITRFYRACDNYGYGFPKASDNFVSSLKIGDQNLAPEFEESGYITYSFEVPNKPSIDVKATISKYTLKKNFIIYSAGYQPEATPYFSYGDLLLNYGNYANFYAGYHANNTGEPVDIIMYPYEYAKDSYRIDSIKYRGYDNTWIEAPARYNLGYYEAAIPYSYVAKTLISGKNVEVMVNQTAVDKKFKFSMYGDLGTENASYVAPDGLPTSYNGVYVKSGNRINLSTSLRKGYNLDSMVIYKTTLDPDTYQPVTKAETKNDAGTLRQLLSAAGYNYAIYANTNISLNTIPYEWVNVSDLKGNMEARNGKYYLNGSSWTDIDVYLGAYGEKDYTYKLLSGNNVDITSLAKTTGMLKEDIYDDPTSAHWNSEKNTTVYDQMKTLTLIPEKGPSGIGGKTLTMEITGVRGEEFKLPLVIENIANRTVTLNKKTDTMPVGGRRTYTATITGNVNPEVTSITLAEGCNSRAFNAYFSSDKKQLIVASTKDATAGEYIVRIGDSIVTGKEYTTLTVKLDSSSLENALPTVRLAQATNNRLTVNLTPGNIDKSLDGLMYQIEAVATLSNNGLKEKVTATTHVSATAYDIWLTDDTLSTAGKASEYTISIKLVQGNKTSKTASIKAMTKDGDIYPTYIRLTGNTSGIYTTTDYRKACRFNVTFDPSSSIQRLARVELINPSGKVIESVDLPQAWADSHINATNNSIEFYPTEGTSHLEAGRYTIKAYAYDPSGMGATATATVNVLQGIEYLHIEPVNKVIKKPGVAVNIPIKIEDRTFSSKPKKATKVKWAVSGGNGKIKVNNGTLMIPANYRPSGNESITVTATANDYAYSNVSASVSFILTSAYSTNTCFKYEKGTSLVELTKDQYTADEIFTGSYAQIAFLEKDTQDNGIDCSYTVKGATLMGTWDYNGVTYASIKFDRAGRITITATAKDGSNRRLTKSINVKYPSIPLYYELMDSSSRTLASHYKATLSDNKVCANNGTEIMPLSLEVFGVKDGLYVPVDQSVTVRGGKASVDQYNPCRYEIYPSAHVTEITVTNKATREKAIIKVTNNAIAEKKDKFKVTASGRGMIYNHLNFNASNNYGTGTGKVAPNLVTFTLENAGDADSVIVRVKNDDLTNGSPITSTVVTTTGASYMYTGVYRLPVTGSDKKTFSLDFIRQDKTFDIKNGVYKLSVTPIKTVTENNVTSFIATDKPVDVNIMPRKAPVTTITMTPGVFFKSSDGKIKVGTKAQVNITRGLNYNKSYGIKINGLYNVNSRGKINKFTDLFAINQAGELSYRGTTDYNTRTAANKANLTGYVSYSYETLEGEIITKYLKVNVMTKR